ncbi:MAG: DNA polymerase III subunit beta [Synergistaceae bacterium]|jgi:DNA polymerase-3 subunit beta|nr:DNA polymerase III subunit beta [Synergistaceae bacterium]
MRVNVDKVNFLKSWGLAERSAGSSGAMNIFSSVRMKADINGVELQATDIKTSIICKAQGVTVIEPGEAVIPLKGVTELFRKAGSSDFMLQVDDEGHAVMNSGKSRYRFSTYPVGDFPKLPSSDGGELLCSIEASKLQLALDRGTLCASTGDEYPQYLSSAYFETMDGLINIVSTDKRRLAICRSEITDGGDSKSILLPMKGLKELQRVLGLLEPSLMIKIIFDDSQAYFVAENVEFAVRRVESKFPAYDKILPTSFSTTAAIDRLELIAAIERVDVVVRDYNRILIINMEPDAGCVLSGRAPEFGEAVENIQCEVGGNQVAIGVNSKYFHDAVKVLDDQVTQLLFNGSDGHMMVRAKESDSFVCLVAPLELTKEQLERIDIESVSE